jgi:hypothetical protein
VQRSQRTAHVSALCNVGSLSEVTSGGASARPYRSGLFRWTALAAVQCLSLGSCTGADAPPPTQGRRPPPEVWSLDPRPLLIVSANGDGSPSSFAGAVGAIRTKDGGIAIGDAASNQVRLYNRSGRFVRSVSHLRDSSRDGGRSVSWLGRCPGNDLVAVQDARSGRFGFYTDEGSIVREVPVPARLRFAQLLACPSDDALLLFQPQPAKVPTGTGVRRSDAHLVRLRRSRKGTDTLRTVRGTEYFFSERTRSFVEQPLGTIALASFAAPYLFVGSGGDTSIEVIDVNGKRLRELSVDLENRSATVGDVVWAVTMRLYQEPSLTTREIIRTTLPQAPVRDSVPRYDALLIDTEGHLWLRSFEIPRRDSVRWRVFDSTGRPLARSDLPASLYLTEIGRDYVVGIHRRAGEVERVAAYALVKNRPVSAH